jgi:ArsR family transcriptional regulator
MSVPTTAFEQIKLLADDTRWRIMQALRTSDMQVSELVEQTGLAQNLVSYHINVLRQAGFVHMHRSDADARANYYGLDLTALSALHHNLGSALAIPSPTLPLPLHVQTVVFLCRANSARSQMAEGWLRALSGGRIAVRSAGTQPTQLHPLALRVMAERGIDIGHHGSKHVDSLAALTPDVVVTVCDIAREACAVWSRAERRIHWSIPDPVNVNDVAERLVAFRSVRDDLHQRVLGLLALLGQHEQW